MRPEVLSAAEGSPLAEPMDIGGFTVGNRWCIHPMEGWDGTTDRRADRTHPSPLGPFRRERREADLGRRGVRGPGDGRANPNQIGIVDDDVNRAERARRCCSNGCSTPTASGSGAIDDICVGLQLTHSGRFCRPYDKKKLEPKIAYHHPILDRKFDIRRRRRFGRPHR